MAGYCNDISIIIVFAVTKDIVEWQTNLLVRTLGVTEPWSLEIFIISKLLVLLCDGLKHTAIDGIESLHSETPLITIALPVKNWIPISADSNYN